MENPIPPNQDQGAIQNGVPTPSTTQTGHKWIVPTFAILVFLSLASTGFLYYRNQQLKNTLIKSQQISPTPTQIPTTPVAPEPTAGWQAYTDTQFGFSLKYPTTYFKYQGDLGHSFFVATSDPHGNNNPDLLAPDDVSLTAGASDTPNSQTIDQFLNSQQSIYVNNSDKHSVAIGGIQGYMIAYDRVIPVSGSFSKTMYILEGIVLKNHRIYEISLSTQNKNVLDADQPILGQILSTFTFTGNQVSKPADKNQTIVNCSANSRQQICSMMCSKPPPYVCGSNGRSYCTACQACQESSVLWYWISNTPCASITTSP